MIKISIRLFRQKISKVIIFYFNLIIDDQLSKEGMLKVLRAMEAEDLVKELTEQGMGSQFWEQLETTGFVKLNDIIRWVNTE